MKEKYLVTTAWVLSIVVSVLAYVAWGQSYSWQFSGMSPYQIFPLFGLIAFSLMWVHYIVATKRLYLGIDKSATQGFFEATSYAVLAAILLHPGLLIWQRYSDGFGLPPGSVYSYVGPSLKLAATIGVLSWCAFLAYEFRRKFKNKPWWRWVQVASDVAILAIFYHSLKLGSHVQTGWFAKVWWFYGVTLVICLVYIYYRKSTPNRLQK